MCLPSRVPGLLAVLATDKDGVVLAKGMDSPLVVSIYLFTLTDGSLFN